MVQDGGSWEEAAIYWPDGPIVAVVDVDYEGRRFRLKELYQQELAVGNPLLLVRKNMENGTFITTIRSGIEPSNHVGQPPTFRFVTPHEEDEFLNILIIHPK